MGIGKILHTLRSLATGWQSAGSTREGTRSLFVEDTVVAMNVATVYSCVKFLSDSVANLPLQHLKRVGATYVHKDNSHLEPLLNLEPSTGLSGFDMWAQAVVNLLLDGNAYIVPIYNPVVPVLDRLVLCSRGTVTHDTLNDTYSVSDSVMGVYGTYDEDEIIHIKWMPGRDQKHGISVLSYARMAINIAASGDKETKKRFDSGGNVRGIVTNDKTSRGLGTYDGKELKKVSIDLDAEFRQRNIVSMPDLSEFKQLSLSSADMEFLGTRKFEVLEICRFFRVHPSFIFSDTSNNYKSAEQANVAFLTTTLNPLLRKIENELNRKLLESEMHGKERIQFDRSGIYACDLATKAKYESTLMGMGWTVNELRALNNMPPVEHGDRAFCSANLRALDEPAVNAPKPSPPAKDEKEEDEKDTTD